MDHSQIDNKRKKNEKQRKSQTGRASKTLRVNEKEQGLEVEDEPKEAQQRYGAKTIKPDSSIHSHPGR